MGLSRTVSEINGDIGRKSQISPPRAVYLMPSPWEYFGTAVAIKQKTRATPLSDAVLGATWHIVIVYDCVIVTGRSKRPACCVVRCSGRGLWRGRRCGWRRSRSDVQYGVGGWRTSRLHVVERQSVRAAGARRQRHVVARTCRRRSRRTCCQHHLVVCLQSPH